MPTKKLSMPMPSQRSFCFCWNALMMLDLPTADVPLTMITVPGCSAFLLEQPVIESRLHSSKRRKRNISILRINMGSIAFNNTAR